jgi:two-component system, response regulator RegA
MKSVDRLSVCIEGDNRTGKDLTHWQNRELQGIENSLPDPRPCDGGAHPAMPQGSLLLVENTATTRSRLSRALAAKGFAVTVVNARAALEASCNVPFAYALVEVQFCDRGALNLIRKLREKWPWLRIVVITDHDSFATVVLALRAGADDYLPIPASEHELADALLERRPPLPPIPETPLGAERVRWEYIQRILTQCGRNVSDTARRLRMHRRTLQRLLSKRAPCPRGSLQP